MIITKAPFRISLFGGGSDLADYYTQSPGAVLSTTIDKYMYISSHRYFEDDKITAKYSVTELVTTEDLFISPEGGAIRDVLDGFYDADGKLPCQIDGGLKCFGHPIGASGIRMLYEMYLQLQGRAGERQLASPGIGLTHNLGGQPSQNVCAISIVGPYR